jgi:hypothetical protein
VSFGAYRLAPFNIRLVGQILRGDFVEQGVQLSGSGIRLDLRIPGVRVEFGEPAEELGEFGRGCGLRLVR